MLFTSCSRDGGEKSVFDYIPAESRSVARVNIDAILKNSGCRIRDGKVTLSPAMEYYLEAASPDQQEFFTSMVERKISAGKESDLLKLARSGKLLEEQSQEFYQIFDEAFLSIYPNFVNDVNRLLRSDQRVTLKKGEKLNTDLRILALMRLGIDDTSRIAQMLNYSVFTIYTYRNKFKSRAIDRNNFERDIFSIPSIG